MAPPSTVLDLTRWPNTTVQGYRDQLPAIMAQPVPATIPAGGSASFTVAAANGLNTVPMAYHWQLSTDGGGTWTYIADGGVLSGAQTPTLTLTGASQAMNGSQYRCVTMDAAFQEAFSSGARLTVQPPPQPQPPSKLPRTGDSFPIVGLGAAILVMGLSLAGMGWLTFRRRVQK